MKPSIEVKNLSKRYRIGGGVPNPISFVRRRLANRSNSDNYHWAVKDLSFSLLPGEALGIIGPNGAGKTTVLKLLSRVTKPTSGEVYLDGRFSALIELGAGFHPDLTGRENIYLNGAILGMKRAEIDERFDDIVEFSGIERFLDTPVKRYSSGMYARLGFSIAVYVDPDILLVDEVLAVGDYAFQVKCHERMDELRAGGTTLIFVSHNMDAVRRVCDRGIVMYQGEQVFHGDAAEAIVSYSDAIRKAAKEAELEKPKENGLAQRTMTFEAEISNVRILNDLGESITVAQSGMDVTVLVDVRFHEPISRPIFAIAIRTPDGKRVYATTTKWLEISTPEFYAGERCRIKTRLKLPLLDGTYHLSVNLGAADLSRYYDRIENAVTFQVVDSVEAKGVVDLDAEITFHNLEKVAEST